MEGLPLKPRAFVLVSLPLGISAHLLPLRDLGISPCVPGRTSISV